MCVNVYAKLVTRDRCIELQRGLAFCILRDWHYKSAGYVRL